MRFTEAKRKRITINITPLIDVLFLLLTFFMVSSTFIEQPGMELELPSVTRTETAPVREYILTVTSDGLLFFDGESIAKGSLPGRLRATVPEMEGRALTLKADKEVSHGTVVELMDIARGSGVKKLVIATKIVPESSER